MAPLPPGDRHCPRTIANSMQRLAPGAEFYQERLERARALPEAERSSDVRAWLAAHAALDAAAPLLPGIETRTEFTEPPGGSAALAALLQYLVQTYCHTPLDPMHPAFTNGILSPQLPPLMHVWENGSNTDMCLTPFSNGILTTGRLPAGGANLALVARLLLLAAATQLWFSDPNMGLRVVGAVWRRQRGAAGAADGPAAKRAGSGEPWQQL